MRDTYAVTLHIHDQTVQAEVRAWSPADAERRALQDIREAPIKYNVVETSVVR